MTWAEAGVILAVVSTAVLIAKEVYTTFWVNPRKDKSALQSAKAQQPEIMRQLELGNFKAAAEGISIAQTFVADQLKYAKAEIIALREKEALNEAEIAKYQEMYEERDKHVRALETKVAKMEGRIETMSEMLEQCRRQMSRLGKSS